MTPIADNRDEPVTLVEHDPRWADRFSEERDLLEPVLSRWLLGGIHHVGSTAVPGLDAKPIIDILAGVQDLPNSLDAIEPLAALEYRYAPYRTDEMHWFCKPDPTRRTHHLHLVPSTSPRFEAELAFRDHLRAHPRRAAEYGALKRRLAVRFRHDRQAYTDAKASFITATLRNQTPERPQESRVRE